MTSALETFSDALANAVEQVGPGIVRVEARRRMPASGIVWSADGVIVTAHHVVEKDDNIGIGLADGRRLTAQLVGRDPTTDLAVLRASLPAGSADLAVPTWAAIESVRVGNVVLALGRPDANVEAALGVVNSRGAAWRTPAGGEIDQYVQADVTMYPGFSGGPLITANGHVVGLNTSAMLRDAALTIPASTVRRVVEALLAHGHMRRGFLGVSAQPARLPAALVEQLKQETGLLLGSVENDGPAAKAGLYMGDTILSLDGQPTRHLDDLMALLSGDRVGRAVPVRFVRGGQVQSVDVTIGERS